MTFFLRITNMKNVILLLTSDMIYVILKSQSRTGSGKPKRSTEIKKGGEMMKSDVKKVTLYLCDPQKNTECPKTICQIPHGCFFTAKKQFAVTDENGKPTKEGDPIKPKCRTLAALLATREKGMKNDFACFNLRDF